MLATPMLQLTILSLSVNGLNSAIEWTCVFDYRYRKKADIVLIQETNLIQYDVARFQNKHYKLIALSCTSNKNQ